MNLVTILVPENHKSVIFYEEITGWFRTHGVTCTWVKDQQRGPDVVRTWRDLLGEYPTWKHVLRFEYPEELRDLMVLFKLTWGGRSAS